MKRILLVVILLAGCKRAPVDVPAPLPPDPGKLWRGGHTTDGCRLVQLKASDHRLVKVSVDGTPTVVGDCPGTRCIASADAILIRSHPESPRRARIQFAAGDSIDGPVGDPRWGTSFPGVVFGAGLVAIAGEDDATFTLIDAATGVRSVFEKPAFENAVEQVWRIHRVDDAVYLKLLTKPPENPKAHVSRLVPVGDAPPSLKRHALQNDKSVGEIVAEGEHSVIVFNDGRRVPLSIPDAKFGGVSVADNIIYAFDDDGGVLVIPKDESTQFFLPAKREEKLFLTNHGVFGMHGVRGVVRIDHTGAHVVAAKTPGHDLGGNPVPNDATLELMDLGGNHERILVVERYRLVTCEIEDRVFLITASPFSLRTVAVGRGARAYPSWARDALYFVESDIEPHVLTVD